MPDYSFLANPTAPQQGINTLNSLLQAKGQSLSNQYNQATLQPRIQEQQAITGTAQEQQQQQHLLTIRSQLANGAQQALSLYGTGATPDQVRGEVTKIMQNAGAQPDAIKQALMQVPDDPAQIDNYLVKQAQVGLSTSEQLLSKFPNMQMGNFGGTMAPVSQGNEATAAQPPGQITGPAIKLSLPPTTQRWNPKTRQMEFVGDTNPPQTANAHPVVTTGSGGGMAASPPLGMPESLGGSVQTMNKDWQDTTTRAENASQNIGVLQTIKQHAPGALTGVEAERRVYLSGLAGLLGIDPGEMAKTNTDVLAKNTNMLALAGGDTNLAKTLAESTNPNIHMTPEAIKQAADQIIAQQKLLLAKKQFMQPYKTVADQTGNADLYNQALTQFSTVSDPRIFQLQDMTPEEKIKMKASMTPQQQKDFSAKIRGMQKLGILQ